MDLSATRRHISVEEKARGMAEGRYYCCGGLGHMVRDCPLGLQVHAAMDFLAPVTALASASAPVPPPEVAVAATPEGQDFQ